MRNYFQIYLKSSTEIISSENSNFGIIVNSEKEYCDFWASLKIIALISAKIIQKVKL